MKKYLALVVLGLMLALAQPSLASCGYGCGCPVMPACPVQSACPVCPQVMPACPVQPACPVYQQVMPACPVTVQPVCAPVQPACPVCAPVQPACPVCAPIQPACPVMPACPVTYNTCNPCGYGMVGAAVPINPCCNPCGYGMVGAAAPILYPQTIIYEEDEGFFEDFFGFD